MSQSGGRHWPEAASLRPMLDLNAGLERLMGERAVYGTVLAQFLATYCRAGEALRAQIQANDHAAALRGAHSLKGAAGLIGALPVEQAAEALETALRSNSAGSGPALEALETALTALLAVLMQLVEDKEPESALTHAAPAEHALLARLASLLELGDAAARELFEAEAEALRARLGAEAFAALVQAMQGLDYEQARRLLAAY